MKRPVFYLFAGINGTGKTSLYQIISEREDLGERVSIDDTARELGDWRDPIVQIKAGRIALRQAMHCIEEKRNFNLETTLPGQVILRQILAAKEQGYRIQMYFLGVSTVDIAVDRVRRRIAKGGHGIPENLIHHRFDGMPEALAQILPLCDSAFFYDNTERFRQIAWMEGLTVMDTDPDLPAWLYYALREVKGIQQLPASKSTVREN